jgi:hypothetical protein
MRGDLPVGDPELDGPEPERHDRDSGPSARTLLIAALVMVVAGYLLTVKLREMSRLQDCVMSGRTNCAPIEENSR